MKSPVAILAALSLSACSALHDIRYPDCPIGPFPTPHEAAVPIEGFESDQSNSYVPPEIEQIRNGAISHYQLLKSQVDDQVEETPPTDTLHRSFRVQIDRRVVNLGGSPLRWRLERGLESFVANPQDNTIRDATLGTSDQTQ